MDELNLGGTPMPTLIPQPKRVHAHGNSDKVIEEYVGRVNTGTASLSIAHMRCPAGWSEPGQAPDFNEYTLVLRGQLLVKHKKGETIVAAGQAIIAHRGEWVQYSVPFDEGAEYIAICLPSFAPELAHRDPE